MIAEIGHFALVLAFALSIAQGTLPLYGAAKGDARLMAFARSSALGQLLFVAVAFVALTTVFVASDFSVSLVAQHSNSAKPLIYKISGVWGNHEGSMLLWVLILAVFGGVVVQPLLVVLQHAVAAVRPLAIGPALGVHLQDAQVQPHLDPRLPVFRDDQAHVQLAGLVGPVAQQSADIGGRVGGVRGVHGSWFILRIGCRGGSLFGVRSEVAPPIRPIRGCCAG